MPIYRETWDERVCICEAGSPPPPHPVLLHDLLRLRALVGQLRRHQLVLHDGALRGQLELLVRQSEHLRLGVLDLGGQLALPPLAILHVQPLHIGDLVLVALARHVQLGGQLGQLLLQQVLGLDKVVQALELVLAVSHARLEGGHRVVALALEAVHRLLKVTLQAVVAFLELGVLLL